MSGITVRMTFKDNQMKANWSYLSKRVLGMIWGDMFLYILIEDGYTYDSSCYRAFSYKFPIPSPWGISSIIQFHLDHLDLTLVNHLGFYLSAYPIRHPFEPSVSWGSQGNIVHGSSPH